MEEPEFEFIEEAEWVIDENTSVTLRDGKYYYKYFDANLEEYVKKEISKQEASKKLGIEL